MVLYLEFSPIHNLKKKKKLLEFIQRNKKRFAIFWVVLKPNLFGLPTCSFGASSNFSTHYFVGDRSHFHRAHCGNNLLGEVGHLMHLTLLLDFYQIIVHFYWRQQVSKVMVYSFPSPLKVGAGTPSFGCCDLHLPFV
jgi:hypothetical protein